MDPEWILRRSIEKFENTYYAGYGYPCIWSNFGAAGHAKYFKGAKYKFERDTMWIGGELYDLEKDELVYDTQSRILAQELEIVKVLCKEGMGKFFVSMPDNCGNLDALAELHGGSERSMGLYDYPELVESCKWLDNAIYHLDAQQQIRHLDMILSIDRLNMIQWIPVAGFL